MDIVIRRLQTGAVCATLSDVECVTYQAGTPTLIAEVERATLTLSAPAVRFILRGEGRALHLGDAETLFASDVLVVDICRSVIRQTDMIVPFATRPMLSTLARALAEA